MSSALLLDHLELQGIAASTRKYKAELVISKHCNKQKQDTYDRELVRSALKSLPRLPAIVSGLQFLQIDNPKEQYEVFGDPMRGGHHAYVKWMAYMLCLAKWVCQESLRRIEIENPSKADKTFISEVSYLIDQINSLLGLMCGASIYEIGVSQKVLARFWAYNHNYMADLYVFPRLEIVASNLGAYAVGWWMANVTRTVESYFRKAENLANQITRRIAGKYDVLCADVDREFILSGRDPTIYGSAIATPKI